MGTDASLPEIGLGRGLAIDDPGAICLSLQSGWAAARAANCSWMTYNAIALGKLIDRVSV